MRKHLYNVRNVPSGQSSRVTGRPQSLMAAALAPAANTQSSLAEIFPFPNPEPLHRTRSTRRSSVEDVVENETSDSSSSEPHSSSTQGPSHAPSHAPSHSPGGGGHTLTVLRVVRLRRRVCRVTPTLYHCHVIPPEHASCPQQSQWWEEQEEGTRTDVRHKAPGEGSRRELEAEGSHREEEVRKSREEGTTWSCAEKGLDRRRR